MEIITSHVNLDFDGLASMVAAKKLFPKAQIVLPNTVSKDVRNFLALYRDFIDLKKFKDIDVKDITKIIIVDTSSYSRVADFSSVLKNENVEVIVFDHHTEEDNVINAHYSEIKKYGACTSILLKRIIENKIEIRPFEATILALGIYTDTNCLTFSSTTVEDAKAVTYLLECGAYLDVISSFVGQPLSAIQKEAFEKLINNIESYTIKGFKIGISAVKFDQYVDEVAYITNRILSLNEYDAFFSIVSIKGTTYIVGRSIITKINVNQIMKRFNGSGHPKAGSAKVKNAELKEIKEKLIQVLNESIEPAVTAKDVASYPVKTVSEEITLDEVDKIMLRYGHSGIPVVREDKVVGIVTRKDIEKAIHLGYGNSPVKAYMSRRIISVSPDTPIREVRNKMIEHNIGRLPVIENGKLIGIVTRTDIIKQVFGEDSPTTFKKIYVEDNKKRLRLSFVEIFEKLNDEIKSILIKIGEIGDKRKDKVYIVGGFVRDIILGYDNLNNLDDLDIDIVVVGDGVQLAKELCNLYEGKIKVHKKFQTAAVKINNKYKVDVVTARREFYEYPAALPTIEKGSIKSDLYRRDFTINSMAICLNRDYFGELVDFFGGQRDLQNKLIRVLHNMSFIEDPTRIFRAIRFESRYNFKIEEQTYKFMCQAIDSDILKKVSDDRISDEILLVLKEKNVDKAILRMINTGIFKKLYPQLIVDDDTVSMIAKAKRKSNGLNYDFTLICLLILFSKTQFEPALEVLNKLKLSKEYRNAVINYVKNKNNITKRLNSKKISNYEIYSNLCHLREEILFVLMTFSSKNVAQNINAFMTNLKGIKILINGETLKKLGVASGPRYKEIFRKIFEAKLNKEIETLEDEIEFVKKIAD